MQFAENPLLKNPFGLIWLLFYQQRPFLFVIRMCVLKILPFCLLAWNLWMLISFSHCCLLHQMNFNASTNIFVGRYLPKAYNTIEWYINNTNIYTTKLYLCYKLYSPALKCVRWPVTTFLNFRRTFTISDTLMIVLK